MNFPVPESPTPVPTPIPTPIPTIDILDHHQVASPWSTFHRIRYRHQRPGSASAPNSPDGTWITGEREFLDRGDAVALLPYAPETGHVLLTRQFRMPIFLKRPAESMLLEVCGGILDHPDPAVTLQHEALDELGLTLGPIQPVFAAYSTPGSVCEKVHHFLAPYIPAQRQHPGGGLHHEGEDIEVLELPLAEALRLIATGQILDLRTIALLYFLAATHPNVLR